MWFYKIYLNILIMEQYLCKKPNSVVYVELPPIHTDPSPGPILSLAWWNQPIFCVHTKQTPLFW